MIKCAEQQRRSGASSEAMAWAIEILKKSGPINNFHQYVNGPSNQVVEVENIFEGQTGDGTKWQMRFIINGDLPNEKLKQRAHFGCEVHWNTERILSTHKWLPDGLLKTGRPTDPGVKLEEFQTGHERKDFDNKRYATWKSISKKYTY